MTQQSLWSSMSTEKPMRHFFQESIWYVSMVDCVDITRGSHDHTNQIGAFYKHSTELKLAQMIKFVPYYITVTCGNFPIFF